ncbi:MAG: TIGR00341 family protein [Muribaculaceae bacterium]|nr:TIGR00341 family protein [Muribaculaceae bacterium]
MKFDKFWNDAKDELQGYFSFNGFLVPEEEAEQSIREGVTFKGTNILILVFAILIASLGLNTNSTAVIIGAMLISPLMGPIIGLGLGVGIEDFELLKRSMRNLTVAAVFSVLASCVYFLISPVSEGHSELLARTSPTIYDVFIGFFGGSAGIFAIASKNKGNVIPGVAIATALMPPLCTVGYGLATLQMNYFFGALYLFLINSIYICLATFIGVKLMKFKKLESAVPQRARRMKRIVYTLAVLTLLPSVYLTYSMLRQERFEMNASRFVSDEFRFPSTQVLSHSASMQNGEKVVNVTLIGKVLPQDSLELALSSRMHFYGLQGAKLNIVQGDGGRLAGNGDVAGHSVGQIYEMAQNALMQKQEAIDSLRQMLANRQEHDSIASRLAPELRVVFPQVAEIAITKAVFGNIGNGDLDTINMALVNYARPMGEAQQKELCRYLEARLRVSQIRLVQVDRQGRQSSGR